MLIKEPSCNWGQNGKEIKRARTISVALLACAYTKQTGRLALFGALSEIGAPASLILDLAAQKDYARATRIEPSPLRTRSQPTTAANSRASAVFAFLRSKRSA